MWKESYEGSNGASGMHFLTEDPRPGHNVMYFGWGKNAYDSVSLKPLWGLAGTFRQDTSGSYYGGAFQLQSSNGNHETSTPTYMLLAGAHPCGFGRNQFTTNIGNGYNFNNAYVTAFGNMDTEQRPTQHFIKDNGDGTHTLNINSMQHGAGTGHEYYSEEYHYNSIPNDLELYDVSPTYNYQTTTPGGWRGIPCGYSALDGTNSGFLTMSNLQNSSYPTYAYLASHVPGSSIQGESSGGSTSTTSGYYSQFAGMSRSDGLPIFFEYRHSWYTPFFRVTKWSGSAWSTLLAAPNSSNGYAPWSYISTSYSYTSNNDTSLFNSGTSDSTPRFASCWFRHSSQPANMYYTVVPWGYAGVPYADIIRWDRGTDTFVGAGVQGISTTYASAYHRTGGSNGWLGFEPYMQLPYESRREEGLTTATSSGHSGTEQAFAYVTACDAHGFANADGSTESAFETEQYPGGGNVLPVSFMNMSSVDGAFDGNAKGRGIFLTTVYSTDADYSDVHQARAVTWVPETPIDWVWCDSGKTTIAAICKNSTYIYQCRKGGSVSTGGYSGSTSLPNSTSGTGYNTSEFNYTVNSTAMAWVHTATIPYQVVQMGIDKHDRLWYITHQAAGPYVSQTTNNDSLYHKQMWMLTTATPHKVNLTGNATTDTISYSGSNIDKTLTIEALNFKGQRLAKTITLNITSTNAQFDNGSQTKDVTTSASATVNETITVTGAGSFNITAAYGA